MLLFLTKPGLTDIAYTWSLFMIDLTLKGSIVLVTAFLISKLFLKAPFQFHYLIIFLGLCSFAVLPAIYQLDSLLFFPGSFVQGFNYNQSSLTFNSKILAELLHNLALSAPWLLMIWLIGFGYKITGIITSIIEMRLLRRHAWKIENTSWNKLLDTLLLDKKTSQKIEIRQTNKYLTPITCGFLKAVVILPGEARGWTEEQQQVVLLHELSHVRRYDNLLQLIAQLIATVFWYNPLVWSAIRLLRHNREGACDDYVLNAGFKPSVYASHLLDIIHACRNNRSNSAQYLNPMVAKERLMNILDTSRIARVLSPKAIILSILMGVIFILPFSAINPVTATEKISPVNFTKQLKSTPSQIKQGHTQPFKKIPGIKPSQSPPQAKLINNQK